MKHCIFMLAAFFFAAKAQGVYLRVDDSPHPDSLYLQLDSVCARHNAHYSLAINPGLVNAGSGGFKPDIYKLMASRGNMVENHTILHNTLKAAAVNAQNYKDAPGVDHIVANARQLGIDWLCLNFWLDTSGRGDMVIDVKDSSGYPVGGFSKTILDRAFGVWYEGRLFKIKYAQMTTEKVLQFYMYTPWDEPVAIADARNTRVKIIYFSDVHPTNEAVDVLLKSSTELFNYYGLHPVMFVHPGDNPYISWAQIAPYLKKYGYIGADMPAVTSEPGSPFTAESDLNLDSASLFDDEYLIWNNFTKGRVTSILTHFSSTSSDSSSGAWRLFLKKLDSLFTWCDRFNVPIRTQEEWIVLQTPSRLLGDVDGDGFVSAADASAILKYVAGLAAIADTTTRWAADISGNGIVTAYDAALILQKAAGLR